MRQGSSWTDFTCAPLCRTICCPRGLRTCLQSATVKQIKAYTDPPSVCQHTPTTRLPVFPIPARSLVSVPACIVKGATEVTPAQKKVTLGRRVEISHQDMAKRREAVMINISASLLLNVNCAEGLYRWPECPAVTAPGTFCNEETGGGSRGQTEN